MTDEQRKQIEEGARKYSTKVCDKRCRCGHCEVYDLCSIFKERITDFIKGAEYALSLNRWRKVEDE